MFLVNFMQYFFLLCSRKICRTNIIFAEPVDPRCYWSYGASNILSSDWGLNNKSSSYPYDLAHPEGGVAHAALCHLVQHVSEHAAQLTRLPVDNVDPRPPRQPLLQQQNKQFSIHLLATDLAW